jgi:hypothetical protein
MASDTDFQFIMGTILGQKQDSPLFKALKKASITNVGGITSLTDQAINRLKYRDDSSRTPVNEELGHGYQQLICCFNAFVLTKNDEGCKPIHGYWQNLTMTAEFQEFQIIDFALYSMTQAPACYQDIDDVLHLSYVPNTSKDIDFNDVLDLSYVPNTAEDNVLTPQAPAPMTVTPGGHTRGNTPFPLRVRDLVLEFKKGIKLDPASFAVLKDNTRWDSVPRTLKAQTACYQDVNDVLDLSYVPSTAEDIVLFEEKQTYMYSLVQASRRKKSSLINQGANGGIAGIDTRVIERHSHRIVDIPGINNHEIATSIPIVTAGAVARSQPGDVILIMHHYTYHPQQGRLIHSPCQLESLANDGNDKLTHIPKETVDCYLFLSVFEMDCRILA